ncbi:MAG: hypothetical protein WAU36_02800, partial [Cyclobacteriaceae bacterium]
DLIEKQNDLLERQIDTLDSQKDILDSIWEAIPEGSSPTDYSDVLDKIESRLSSMESTLGYIESNTSS